VALVDISNRKTHALTCLTSDSGAQPLVNEDSSLALAVNGEIYNHRTIRKNLHHKYNFKTHSDCEVIIPLVRFR
jgi:asparagine synthase (glutamine-hydrolysing)